MTHRVAFDLIESVRWAGGYNYLLNLFRALRHMDALFLSRPSLSSQDILPRCWSSWPSEGHAGLTSAMQIVNIIDNLHSIG